MARNQLDPLVWTLWDRFEMDCQNMSLETFLAEFQRQQGLEVNFFVILGMWIPSHLNWVVLEALRLYNEFVPEQYVLAYIVTGMVMFCRSPCFHSERVFYMQNSYLAKSCRTECHSL